MLQFTVSKTYEVITEESAEVGEAEERGFDYQDEAMDFRDVVKELRNCNATSCSPMCFHAHCWATNYGEMDMFTGDYRNESIHISKVNGKPITGHQLKRLFKAAGLIK